MQFLSGTITTMMLYLSSIWENFLVQQISDDGGFIIRPDFTPVADAHKEFGLESPPWFYLNSIKPNSYGAQIVSSDSVEAMDILNHNCSVNFQLYMGDGGPNYGGYASLNLGSDSECLLSSSNCGGIGVIFESTPSSNKLKVKVGESSTQTNDDIFRELREQWMTVNVDFITFNGTTDDRALFVDIDGNTIFENGIRWSKHDLQIDPTWFQNMSFVGENIDGDEHIVQGIYMKCVNGFTPYFFDPNDSSLSDDMELSSTRRPFRHPVSLALSIFGINFLVLFVLVVYRARRRQAQYRMLVDE